MHPVSLRPELLRCLAGKRGGNALLPPLAMPHPRAERAGGIERRTDRRPKIEQSLREIGRLFHRRRIGPQLRGLRCNQRSGLRQRRLNGEQAAGDALHIAIHRHCGNTERDRTHRRGGIHANPGQAPQSLDIFRKGPHPGNPARAGQQIARPRVITKPGPGGHHRFIRGCGQRLHGGETGDETLEIGYDGCNGGLLEHHLTEPDAVRIGRFPRQSTPWQGTAMPGIPLQKRRGRRNGRSFQGKIRDQGRYGCRYAAS
ncbi:Hypothetical protein GbCGDNIH8_8668 [Granulibacter bethesdensis]|nr:Hypothetical protein GbCGDNIH8_8668 [Granulibacter bethesdensis]